MGGVTVFGYFCTMLRDRYPVLSLQLDLPTNGNHVDVSTADFVSTSQNSTGCGISSRNTMM